MSPSQPEPVTPPATPTPESAGYPRRSFMTSLLAVVCGALAMFVPLGAGLAFFFDPLLRRKKSDDGDFVKVTTLDALPADGTPRDFQIHKDIVDAWNTLLNQPVGQVYLRKISDGNVVAFNRTCPHLGCAVDYKPVSNNYYCPCHASSFDLEGERTNQIPPRGMDRLEVEIRNDNEVWVRFQNFRGTTPEKIPVA